MADEKLSELVELAATPADDDEIYIRDISEEAANESKKITIANLMAAIPTKTLNPANETVEAGYYAATTLSAVDGDLVVGNIKKDVNIFGKTGTYEPTITHDAQNSTNDPQSKSGSRTVHTGSQSVSAGGDFTCLTTTITCAGATVIEAAYFVSAKCSVSATAAKLQMYIDGVAQGETAYLDMNEMYVYGDKGNKSVSSGNRTVYVNCHNYHGGSTFLYWTGGVFAGCTKLT